MELVGWATTRGLPGSQSGLVALSVSRVDPSTAAARPGGWGTSATGMPTVPLQRGQLGVDRHRSGNEAVLLPTPDGRLRHCWLARLRASAWLGVREIRSRSSDLFVQDPVGVQSPLEFGDNRCRFEDHSSIAGAVSQEEPGNPELTEADASPLIDFDEGVLIRSGGRGRGGRMSVAHSPRRYTGTPMRGNPLDWQLPPSGHNGRLGTCSSTSRRRMRP